MSNPPIISLLERLGEDEQLFCEVAEVAARHGIDLFGGELSEDALDAVAGGNLRIRQLDVTSAAMDREIDSSKSSYDSSRELSRLAQSVLRMSQQARSHMARKLTQ